jgi:hypothetical protein
MTGLPAVLFKTTRISITPQFAFYSISDKAQPGEVSEKLRRSPIA